MRVKRWTEEEDSILRNMIKKGISFERMSIHLHRTLGAVKVRASTLGLRRKPHAAPEETDR